jgi:hypothetical protein
MSLQGAVIMVSGPSSSPGKMWQCKSIISPLSPDPANHQIARHPMTTHKNPYHNSRIGSHNTRTAFPADH